MRRRVSVRRGGGVEVETQCRLAVKLTTCALANGGVKVARELARGGEPRFVLSLLPAPGFDFSEAQARLAPDGAFPFARRNFARLPVLPLHAL